MPPVPSLSLCIVLYGMHVYVRVCSATVFDFGSLTKTYYYSIWIDFINITQEITTIIIQTCWSLNFDFIRLDPESWKITLGILSLSVRLLFHSLKHARAHTKYTLTPARSLRNDRTNEYFHSHRNRAQHSCMRVSAYFCACLAVYLLHSIEYILTLSYLYLFIFFNKVDEN